MVKNGLRWVREQPQISFILPVSRQSLLALAQQLISASAGSVVVEGKADWEPPARDAKAEISVLADMRNSEALCSAHILRQMLLPHLTHDGMLSLEVLASCSILSSLFRSLVLICSNGCFYHPQFVRLLLEAADQQICWVPVLQKENFRFPSPEFLKALRGVGQQLIEAAGRWDSPDTLIFVIEMCFKEIAIVFKPQKYSSTIRLLHVKGKEVALRLQGHRKFSMARNLSVPAITDSGHEVDVEAIEGPADVDSAPSEKPSRALGTGCNKDDGSKPDALLHVQRDALHGGLEVDDVAIDCKSATIATLHAQCQAARLENEILCRVLNATHQPVIAYGRCRIGL